MLFPNFGTLSCFQRFCDFVLLCVEKTWTYTLILQLLLLVANTASLVLFTVLKFWPNKLTSPAQPRSWYVQFNSCFPYNGIFWHNFTLMVTKQLLKDTVFWDILPCNRPWRYRCCEGTQCLHLNWLWGPWSMFLRNTAICKTLPHSITAQKTRILNTNTLQTSILQLPHFSLHSK